MPNLKLIPTESAVQNDLSNRSTRFSFGKRKSRRTRKKRVRSLHSLTPLNKQPYGPPDEKKIQTQHHSFFEEVGSFFMRFVTKGSKFTVGQIDDLIDGLQRCILKLQKEKHEKIKRKLK